MSVVVPPVVTILIVLLTIVIDRTDVLLAGVSLIALVAWRPRDVVLNGRLVAMWTLPFVLPLVVIHGVLNPAFEATRDFRGIPLRSAGLAYAADVTARLVAIAIAAVTWHGVHRMQILVLAQVLRVPHVMTVAIAAAVSGLALVEARVHAVALAQQARGLPMGPGLRRRIRALVNIVLPVVTTTLVESHHRGTLMTLRGLGSTRLGTAGTLEWGWPDGAKIVGVALLALVAMFWS
jgi:energy-coupling factor transport system permease protein